MSRSTPFVSAIPVVVRTARRSGHHRPWCHQLWRRSREADDGLASIQSHTSFETMPRYRYHHRLSHDSRRLFSSSSVRVAWSSLASPAAVGSSFKSSSPVGHNTVLSSTSSGRSTAPPRWIRTGHSLTAPTLLHVQSIASLALPSGSRKYSNVRWVHTSVAASAAFSKSSPSSKPDLARMPPRLSGTDQATHPLRSKPISGPGLASESTRLDQLNPTIIANLESKFPGLQQFTQAQETILRCILAAAAGHGHDRHITSDDAPALDTFIKEGTGRGK